MTAGGDTDSQCASVAERDRTLPYQASHGSWEREQSQNICDRRPVFADSVRNLLLRKAEFAHEPLVSGGLLNRIEVCSLQILDERHR